MSNCHTAKFYWDDDDLHKSVAKIACNNLDDDVFVLIIVKQKHLDDVVDLLSERGVAVDRARARGQLAFEDADQLHQELVSDGPPDREELEREIEDRFTGMLEEWPEAEVAGQLTASMVRAGDVEEAKIIEDLCTELCGDRLNIRCTYSLDAFSSAEAAEQFWEVCHWHPTVEPGGETAGGAEAADLQRKTMVLATEVREHKEGEQQLEEAVEYEQRVNQRKNQFLGMLAHELRNPIAAILHAAELMELRGDETTERERNIILRQIRHMTRLVDDLLDVSRITRGEIQLDRQPLDLEDVVEQAVETSRPAIEENDHQLHVSIAENPATVDGDCDRLVQVVSNLLTNAAQYTDEGGNIWLDVEPETDAVVLRVRDDGKGIDADTLPNIFDFFFREDGEVKAGEGTLGIGLALAKRIVELHGGSIEASSGGAGEGSEFTVRLPRRQDSTVSEDGGDVAMGEERPTARILLADDNRDFADTLGETLEFFGHVVETVYDGASALDAVEAFDPEVALIDLNMPEMTGYELAGEARQRHPGDSRLPLIALTGYSDRASRQKSQEAEFDAHLVKPVSPEELQETIERVLAAN